SPLLAAAFARSARITRILLEHGADPNADYGYEPPLEFAVDNDLSEIALLLLEHGAKPRSNELWKAVYAGMDDVAKKLVDAGAGVDDTVPAGSPLTAAVDRHDIEMVRFLLEHGADPDASARRSDGSAVDHARRTHQTRILDMLLDAQKKNR